MIMTVNIMDILNKCENVFDYDSEVKVINICHFMEAIWPDFFTNFERQRIRNEALTGFIRKHFDIIHYYAAPREDFSEFTAFIGSSLKKIFKKLFTYLVSYCIIIIVRNKFLEEIFMVGVIMDMVITFKKANKIKNTLLSIAKRYVKVQNTAYSKIRFYKKPNDETIYAICNFFTIENGISLDFAFENSGNIEEKSNWRYVEYHQFPQTYGLIANLTSPYSSFQTIKQIEGN
jgi:hypothetical protein